MVYEGLIVFIHQVLFPVILMDPSPALIEKYTDQPEI